MFDGHGCVPWRAPFVVHGFAFPGAQLAIQTPQFLDSFPWVIGCLVHPCANASPSDSLVRGWDREVQSTDHRCFYVLVQFVNAIFEVVLYERVRLTRSIGGWVYYSMWSQVWPSYPLCWSSKGVNGWIIHHSAISFIRRLIRWDAAQFFNEISFELVQVCSVWSRME